jgi:hypothetical protein
VRPAAFATGTIKIRITGNEKHTSSKVRSAATRAADVQLNPYPAAAK